ncbi:MAG TPA: thioredoxin domain-containing protein [Burkholderiales bacterium]|nr:thioredoxin domain-containing protein [Burkholderiales bacterium]
MANRLAGQTSPYLQQHAHNPVDWYPWGEEALERARREDKPILLSIGYSACHWCHVMAHESFEDPEVAAVMNRLFVNIKVDREERPDLDQIYQTAHALLIRRNGGWPLTMFLTPDGKPFFGGTYFPRAARYGLPGFVDVLEQVAQAWRTRRADIEAQNAALLEVLQSTLPAPVSAEVTLTDQPLELAVAELLGSADLSHGGFGSAPKFPHPAELEFCLRFGARQSRLREHALFTLERMAQGGIYDQLGGGFCRYSVDAYWMIPHFEKMLYDNGPLLALYADAWAATRQPLYQRVAEETAQWVMREMQSPEGGYYSSLDADSEHEEGKFYVWSREEVARLLTSEEYAVTSAHYGLERPPNFENRHWHLYVAQPLGEVAATLGVSVQLAQECLRRARSKLFQARERRMRPGRDEKILTGWNALMIRGMAHAARVFGRRDWLDSAHRALDFVSARMRNGARLFATYKDGRAHLSAYLDDYACLAQAALECLQADFRVETLRLAVQLVDAMLEWFEDRTGGGFFFTGHDHERLILRPKPGHDSATPSGNGVAALVLARLGHLLGEPRYLEAAERTVRAFFPSMCRQPSGFATFSMALAELLAPTRTVVLRGPPDELSAWARELAGLFMPDTLLLGVDTEQRALPPALDKPAGPRGAVNAYVCEGVSCNAPVSDLRELQALLAQERPGQAGKFQETAKRTTIAASATPIPRQER